ncbi:MAG: DUF692 domain-containing protein [Rhodospirillaceae bacterium]
MTTLAQPQTALPIDVGIGLKGEHVAEILRDRPQIGWLEVHTENYMSAGGPPQKRLEALRQIYPLSMHGVALSLGGAERPDAAHLDRIRSAAVRHEPARLSEHLAWSGVGGIYQNDLLPLPLNEESLATVARNVDIAQTRLKRQILVENPSQYLSFRSDIMEEPDFLAELAARTGCGLLLDVNNIAVSAANLGFNAQRYLTRLAAQLDPGTIGEIHLAGHASRIVDGVEIRIDDHGSRVCPEVWGLYDLALELFGPQPTLIEWDSDIPALSVLLEELTIARDHLLAAATAQSAKQAKALTMPAGSVSTAPVSQEVCHA